MITLGNKYRPIDWNDVVEQDSIVTILNRQIETGNVRNSYMFTGKSGGGKTTCARVFANKLGSIPIEVDAASNSGVDNIRLIIEDAQERSISSKYKVYILN